MQFSKFTGLLDVLEAVSVGLVRKRGKFQEDAKIGANTTCN